MSYQDIRLEGVLPLCREAVGVFYSPSRLGKSVFDRTVWKKDFRNNPVKYINTNLQWTHFLTLLEWNNPWHMKCRWNQPIIFYVIWTIGLIFQIMIWNNPGNRIKLLKIFSGIIFHNNDYWKQNCGCPRGVMVKEMDCGIVVSEFVLQSHYYVHFRANTLGKVMNPVILLVMS